MFTLALATGLWCVWVKILSSYAFSHSRKKKKNREIGMENSNYGGMENVGNTTILSSRLTPSKWLVDGGHVYMEVSFVLRDISI